MNWTEEVSKIKQNYSATEISFIIEELRQHVNQTAILQETVSRANGTLTQDRIAQQIDRCLHYGLTHAAE